jgi:hypothetical protein
MSHKHFRRSPALAGLLAGAALAALALAGCSESGDSIFDPGEPAWGTPGRAVDALREAYGQRDLETALLLHDDSFRFVPDPSADIPFLEPGETSWDWEREVAILERLLVPERLTWLDQVLLEISISEIVQSDTTDTVIVRGDNADLILAKGGTQLYRAKVNLELVYVRGEDGNLYLVQMGETATGLSEYTFGELKGILEDPPMVETTDADDITDVSARLNGNVNAMGLPSVFWFEWGTTTAYGNATPEMDAGENFVPVPRADVIGGLAPGTQYHFRVVARSEWGTTRGDDVTFTTNP